MSVTEFPRLITEVLLGTDRYQKLKALQGPPVRFRKDQLRRQKDPLHPGQTQNPGPKNAAVRAHMAVMAHLLKRIIRFIVRVTLAMGKIRSNKPILKPYLPEPNVQKFIRNLIQRA